MNYLKTVNVPLILSKSSFRRIFEIKFSLTFKQPVYTLRKYKKIIIRTLSLHTKGIILKKPNFMLDLTFVFIICQCYFIFYICFDLRGRKDNLSRTASMFFFFFFSLFVSYCHLLRSISVESVSKPNKTFCFKFLFYLNYSF